MKYLRRKLQYSSLGVKRIGSEKKRGGGCPPVILNVSQKEYRALRDIFCYLSLKEGGGGGKRREKKATFI